MWHRRDLGGEELAAGVDFDRQRLVLRRDAPHGVGDHAVDEFEPVIGALLRIFRVPGPGSREE